MATKRSSPSRGSKMKSLSNVVYVVGHAKLPAETTAKHVYELLSLGLALDKDTKKVLEVSCTIVPPYGAKIIREILLGKKIDDELDVIVEEIHSRYVCRTRNALIAALDDLLKRLREHEKRHQ